MKPVPQPLDETLLPDEALGHVLEKAGYHVTRDAKGHYCWGMVRLVGGLEALRFLREPQLVRLFSNVQLRKGRAFTYRQMRGIAKPTSSEDVTRLLEHLQRLAGQKVLLRGYNLCCPTCHLDTWYDLSAAGEHIVCQGCRATFQLPLELPFAYRLNHLFIQGLKNGALTVLLTALLLYDACPGEFVWGAGYSVTKDGHKADIDLVARCGGVLILAECKDRLPASENDNQIRQLERSLAVAREVSVQRFVLATLQETIPDTIADFMQATPGTLIARQENLMRGWSPELHSAFTSEPKRNVMNI